MTKLERLADWISGGALTQREEVRVLHWSILDDLHKRSAALRAIAVMETPGANVTVRRMAKVAREALG